MNLSKNPQSLACNDDLRTIRSALEILFYISTNIHRRNMKILELLAHFLPSADLGHSIGGLSDEGKKMG